MERQLADERAWRREDRFVGLVLLLVLLDVVFFSVLPNFGGPLALLGLELLVLIPVASRMGLGELERILSSVIGRLAGRATKDE